MKYGKFRQINVVETTSRVTVNSHLIRLSLKQSFHLLISASLCMSVLRMSALKKAITTKGIAVIDKPYVTSMIKFTLS
jgi:hypothetical protein